MNKKYLLFDFDGVIADSFEPAFSVSKMRCPDITEDDYRSLFKGNINDSNENASYHSIKCNHAIDFFTEYIPKLRTGVRPFNGISDTLRNLKDKYELIIITSTITEPVVDFLNNEKMNYFRDILGNDFHKSKVEKIKWVLDKYNLVPNDCVFITDTVGDIKEARQVNIGAIAVSWGFHDHKLLQENNPFKIVNSPSELIIAVNEYFDTI